MNPKSFPEPPLLGLTRRILLFSGFLDLIATALLVGSYFLHPGLPPLQFLALAFQFIHLFSWLGTFVLGSDNMSPWFTILMVAILGTSFVGDLIAFVIRTSTPASGHDVFDSFVMWTTFALALIDIFSAVVAYLVSVLVERHRRAGFEFTESYVKGQSRFDSLYREGIASYYLRTTALPLMWKLQLFVLGLLALMIVFGFNRSAAFTKLAAFEIPQAMTWLLLAAVSGTVVIFPSDSLMNVPWIILSLFVLLPTLLAGIAAWILRLFLLLTDADPLPPPVASLYQIFGWIQFGFGAVLVFITLIEIGSLAGALAIKLGFIVPEATVETNERREQTEKKIVDDFASFVDRDS